MTINVFRSEEAIQGRVEISKNAHEVLSKIVPYLLISTHDISKDRRSEGNDTVNGRTLITIKQYKAVRAEKTFVLSVQVKKTLNKVSLLSRKT